MKKNTTELVLLIILSTSFITIGMIRPAVFFTMQNIQSMSFQIAEFGVICLGMMMVMMIKGIDLSIVSITTLAGIMGAFVLSSGMEDIVLKILLAVAVTMTVAFLCGLINGVIVSYIGVSSMIATLGTSILYAGIGLNLTAGGAISGFPEAYHWVGNGYLLGIPVPLILFAFIIGITIYVLSATQWGKQVILVGIDATAAKYSGIYTEKIVMYSFIYSALLAGGAAVIMSARYNSIRVDYGSSYLIKSIVAVMLAQSSTSSGNRRVLGVVLAAAVLQVLSSGFNILGLSQSTVDWVMGLMLIIVLIVNHVVQRHHLRNA